MNFQLIETGSIEGMDFVEIVLGKEIKEFLVDMRHVVVPAADGLWNLYINNILAIPGAAPQVHTWGGYWQWHGVYIDGCWEIAVTKPIVGDYDANKNGGAAQAVYTQLNRRITTLAESLKIAMSKGADNAATSGEYTIYGR